MLAPQFSLRSLLALVSVAGIFFVIVSLAARGSLWAIAISLAVVSLAALLLLHAGAFFLLWLFSLLVPAGRKKSTPGNSPFKAARDSGVQNPFGAG